MDTSKPEAAKQDDFKGADMIGAQDGTTRDTKEQVDKGYSSLGYSDLEVVQTPDLEVAGSDASQAIPPPLYRPKFMEQQSYAEQPLPELNHHQTGASHVPDPSRGSTANDYHYNGGKNPFHSSADSAINQRICGVRSRVFWIVFAVSLLGIVLALAVGLGVGLGVRSTSDSSARYVTLMYLLSEYLQYTSYTGRDWQGASTHM